MDTSAPVNQITFEPASDWLLLKPLRANQTAGGLALPDGVDDGAPKAEVVKAGPGRIHDFTGELVPMPFKVGQKVLLCTLPHSPYMDKVPFGGVDYQLIRARDIIGHFTPPGLVPPLALPESARN